MGYVTTSIDGNKFRLYANSALFKYFAIPELIPRIGRMTKNVALHDARRGGPCAFDRCSAIRPEYS